VGRARQEAMVEELRKAELVRDRLEGLERFSQRLQRQTVSAIGIEAADVFGGDRLEGPTRRFHESFSCPSRDFPEYALFTLEKAPSSMGFMSGE
jgi:hypothetical protein